MMKKKTLTAWGVSALMLLALGGCGKQVSVASEAPKPAVESEKAQEETSDNDVTPSVSEEAEGFEDNTAAAEGFVPILVEEITQYAYDDVNYVQSASMTVDKFHLTEEGAAVYTALSQALEAYNEEAYQKAVENYDRLKAYADEMDAETLRSYYGLTTEDKGMIMRADTQIVSIRNDEYWFGGGPHPDSSYHTENFDTMTGKRLAVADIMTDSAVFPDLIYDRLDENYLVDAEAFGDVKGYLQNLDLTDPEAVSWTADYEGVTVYFSTYELGGSYAAGPQMVRFDYDEGIFKDGLTTVPDSYVMPIKPWETVTVDVDGDGDKEELSVSSLSSDDGYHTMWEVSRDGTMVRIDGGFEAKAYLVRANESYYLYLFVGMEDDANAIHVIDLKTMSRDDEKVLHANIADKGYFSEERGEDYYWSVTSCVFLDPSHFSLSNRLDVLSTQNGSRTYYIDDAGYPATDSPWLDLDGTFVLTAKKDVVCDMVDADGNVEAEGLIPATMMLSFVRSDGESWADFQAVDESETTVSGSGDYALRTLNAPRTLDKDQPIFRVYVDTSDWPHKVNGEDEEASFANIRYAG